MGGSEYTIDPKEAAGLLGVSVPTFYKLVRDGVFSDFARIGKENGARAVVMKYGLYKFLGMDYKKALEEAATSTSANNK